jgi:hypothetical protein
MRTLHILLALLMLSFVAVQYNDPDGPLWAVIYLIPAAWALLAAFRLAVVRSSAGKSFLWASTVAGLAGVIYYWPTMSGFWRKDVWWVEETAREGMGMMIAFVVLVVVLFNAHRKPASS